MTWPEPRRIEVPGTTVDTVALSVHDTGGAGPPVFLLHGWPDRASLWAPQAVALAERGYRVVAPDLRGLGESDRPDGVAHYALEALQNDVLGVADALGIDRFALAAHDWGAGVGWRTCLTSDRVTRYAAFSVGHPAAFATAGRTQRELSWYSLWFLFPGVAEQVLPADDWHQLHAMAHRSAPADLARRHVEDLARPGALTASLNLYRANVDPLQFVAAAAPALPPITIPVMGVWGDRDDALTEAQMRRSGEYVGDFRFEVVQGCGHWVPQEAPARTTELLLDFLEAGSQAGR